MTENTEKESSLRDPSVKKQEPRMRGVGNKESHSQDADRHRKVEHQKSDK